MLCFVMLDKVFVTIDHDVRYFVPRLRKRVSGIAGDGIEQRTICKDTVNGGCVKIALLRSNKTVEIGLNRLRHRTFVNQ